MSALQQTFRWLLWKLFQRDCLVLRPGWAVVHRDEQHVLVGPTGRQPRTLPISYNGCTPKTWQLQYNVHGRERGSLRYRLAAPGKPPFCEMMSDVQLPWKLAVSFEDGRLVGNGKEVPLIPGATVPRDASCLVGEFLFQAEKGSPAIRRTAHRVVASGDVADATYFQGSVYDDYEARPGMFPDQILAAIGRYRPLQGRFLDVGCATGMLVRHAESLGLTAEGIDVSSWAVGKANERHPASCRVLDFDRATSADFPVRYDIIVLHSVLEHLANPEQSLRLLHEVVQPGGIVYVQTLNADSLMHKLRGEDWSGYADYTHRSPWITTPWLEKTAKVVGFEVLDAKCYGIWNEEPWDEAWNAFGALVQLPPASALLEEQFGDFVEIILRRPAQPV